jgi:hypothetical protein
MDVARRRLHSVLLAGGAFAEPEEAVRWLVAVQAQDYAGAKWALAQRMPGGTDAALERAVDTGAIVRTHVLRPTWHFVAPADARWLIELTAPRIRAAMAYQDRKLGLDAATLRRSEAALARALEGGRHRTREELGSDLAEAGVEAAGQRLGQLVMHAELRAVVCSGPRRGKQFTYALFDERVPVAFRAKKLARDEALAELARRYFASRGPASAHDYAWWSGLTLAEARRGIELAGRTIASEVDGERTWWFAPSHTARPAKDPLVHLLPNYDEYIVAYKDRSDAVDPQRVARLSGPGTRDLFLSNPLVVVDGRVVGTWRRTLEKGAATVHARVVGPLPAGVRGALAEAARRFGRFLGVPCALRVTTLRAAGAAAS